MGFGFGLLNKIFIYKGSKYYIRKIYSKSYIYKSFDVLIYYAAI